MGTDWGGRPTPRTDKLFPVIVYKSRKKVDFYFFSYSCHWCSGHTVLFISMVLLPNSFVSIYL